LQRLNRPPGLDGALSYGLFAAPVVGTAAFNALVSRPSLRYYLTQSGYFDTRLVTREMIDNYYTTGHKPGAKWAPAAFVAGRLNLDIRAAYLSLPQPVFIVWGQQAAFTPVTDIQRFRQLREPAKIRVFDCARLLPHDEHAEEFNALVRSFLQMPGSAA
jgi:pimeloyl-ACP methyl ester carboxylesterase